MDSDMTHRILRIDDVVQNGDASVLDAEVQSRYETT